ncbi:MAG: AAA family ATPase [Eubacteriales bacterium]
MTHKLIIIRGNSGSGKTSAAKRLQKMCGANTMLISSDMVRMEILNVHGAEGAARSQELMRALLQYGRQNNEITILEGILPKKDYHGLFEAAIEVYGQNIYAFYYDLPFEETLRRHQTKPNCGSFGEAEMKRWWIEKDYLDILSEYTLTKEISLDDAADLIYHKVMS